MSTQPTVGIQPATTDVVREEAGMVEGARRKSTRAKKRGLSGFLFKVIALVVFFCSAFPVYWMVNLSFTPNRDIVTRDKSFFPTDFTLNNYVTAWTREARPGQSDFQNSLLTTTTVTLSVLFVTILIAFAASIAIARFRFKGRYTFILSIIIIQMIPGEAMMFTLYGMIDDWQLMNTMLGLGIVYTASVVPFTVWMLRGFVTGVPADLEEAAMIDGCTRTQAFWKVTFPLLAPGLVSTGIFAFIQAWNEFTMALLLMSGKNLTLMPWLMSFTTSSVGGQVNWGAVMAGSVMISIPVVIFFLIVQGRMTGGLVSGAVKG
ncbi:carbohydrate ABC transporter permease [Microbacterium sp. NIBRBAC000506063]|uniref:carbohydrate ABC transporter permease n=1 Tax=Microbacterium sp. NIBRBAC000506063 TaxID=2734618 RepID=UPI001BB6208C|nr:carbohydrate ABC transporter permease [Microbacterium sp. NIBRBAC000506063]QTV79339.1 carbohydrate ABC transporter permease [Microbacterium sp. NIBRBAC000506063]